MNDGHFPRILIATPAHGDSQEFGLLYRQGQSSMQFGVRLVPYMPCGKYRYATLDKLSESCVREQRKVRALLNSVAKMAIIQWLYRVMESLLAHSTFGAFYSSWLLRLLCYCEPPFTQFVLFLPAHVLDQDVNKSVLRHVPRERVWVETPQLSQGDDHVFSFPEISNS